MALSQTRGLDRRSSIPLYHQVRELIKKYIFESSLEPGTLLPSEAEMMVLWDASRGTIRSALADLEKEGIIYKIQGKGTYVAPPRLSQRFRTLISFHEEIQAKGLISSSTVLAKKVIPAGPDVAKKLGLKSSDLIIFVKRIRYASGRPAALNTSHLNAQLCPKLLTLADVSQGSLYEMVYRHYGIRITKADRTIESIPCPDDLARLLMVPPEEPILESTGVSYAESGVPLDYYVEYYRDDF